MQSFLYLLSGNNTIMKVAVTYENGEVFQHFGHTEQFKIYEIEGESILSSRIISTGGKGHGALSGLLQDLKIDALICGGIGAGAQTALKKAKIRLYGGVSGSTDDAVQALACGQLSYNPDIQCSHHDHQDKKHVCGEHGCGNH